MKETLDTALTLELANEGGFSDNKADPGGATYKGVTLRTLTALWLGRDPHGSSPTVADLKALSDDAVKTIFTQQYADPIRYADLPKGVDYCVLDASVNSGPGRAARLLQTAVGMTGRDVDGVIGAHTLSVVTAMDASDLIAKYNADRLAFMQTLKAWSTFSKGWTNRVEGVTYQAQAFALGNQPAPNVTEAASQAKATGPTKLLASMNGKAAVGSIAGAAIFLGGLASQISSVLQPYGSIKAVAYVLIGCSVVASAVPLWTAIKAASSGEKSA